MIAVLMVCLGNICRSPLAEGILKSKVNSKKIFVDSAGTSAWHIGKSPDPRSIEVAAKYGIDIALQKARQLTQEDFDKFDLIYVMDASNYQNVLKLARNKDDRSKVKMILNESYPSEDKEVPDPYYGGALGFENVYQMLENACDSIVKKTR
jgi:protein-tyrosine phosphatase